MVEITRVSKEEDFLNLKDPWNALLVESGLGNIFLTWEWMYNWWMVFKSKKDDLFILLCQEGSVLLGIAPFYISDGLCKKIKFLGSGIVFSDYLSFIAKKEDKSAVLGAITGYLSHNSHAWDLLYLYGLNFDDGTTAYLEKFSNSNNLLFKIVKEHRCPYLPLFSPFEEFKKSLAHSQVKGGVQKKIKKLSAKGAWQWKELSCSDEGGAMSNCETLVSLHQKRWTNSGRKSGGLFSNKLFLEFIRAITREFYKNNWLSITCLFFNDNPISCGYYFKFNKKIMYYLAGFDPDYTRYSPSSICISESLKFYIEKGYEEFDFLMGEDKYKWLWTDKFHKELDILIVKRSPKCSLFLACTSFQDLAKKILKKIVSTKLYDSLRSFKFSRSR